jgi:cyclic beta-1,2-glucan synthetase
VEATQAKLAATRAWWLGRMRTLRVETSDAAFDRHLNWLKYQAVVERLWARKGFYQSSGAFGFRDQLQDAVNLIWVDPALARRQILLHGRQQFVEGDVLHWFFLQPDGGTGLGARTHASDNLLWLGWAAAEYVRLTGDETILDEKLPYLEAEMPLPPLPEGRHGMGLFAHVSPHEETLCDHVLRAVDLVLEKRLGAHGLPLIGTGDWNDGLDAIGSEGRGESVWLGFFLHYTLENLLGLIERCKGPARRQFYCERLNRLKAAIESTWRGDRYLRAIHDDGTEIGVKDSGIWEIDVLTAAWAVMSGINRERGRIMFDTALRVLERDAVILLGWPALREDSKPYLGRSSHYPEGVRENGMYCHGVQWLIGAAHLLAGQFAADGDPAKAQLYRDTTIRLWRKIAPVSHVTPDKIEIYGGQPNQQAADLLTNFEPGRMIWNGYTGAAGWMLRQSCEGVIGATLVNNHVVMPDDLTLPRGDLKIVRLQREIARGTND